MKGITPYLNFNGNCREAMTFYQRCLGGELKTMTFGETDPKSPPEMKDRLMHANLSRGDFLLMASDAPLDKKTQPGTTVWLSLECDTDAEVDSLFKTMSENGRPNMAPHDAFWGARFAMFTDQFGMNWMLNHAKAPVPQR